MRLVLRAAVLAVLSLTVPAIAEPVTLQGLTFPDRVDGFARGPGRDYEATHPGLGHSFPYHREPWTATVYVYDLRSRVPDGLSSPAITKELAAATRDVLEGARRGIWRKADLVREFTLPERGPARFACVRFTIVNLRDETVDSTLCLASSKGRFVKFRVTGPGKSSAEPLRFIEAWIPLLWPGA